jgi:hypothetical protein
MHYEAVYSVALKHYVTTVKTDISPDLK